MILKLETKIVFYKKKKEKNDQDRGSCRITRKSMKQG